MFFFVFIQFLSLFMRLPAKNNEYLVKSEI